MRSRHPKQRQWRKELPKRQYKPEIKEKGATVDAVHPSEIQPLNPCEKVKGATLGKLSNIWPSVKWRSAMQ